MQHDIQPPLNGISMFGSYPHDTEGNEHLISMKEWISKAIHAINSSSTSNGSLNSHLRPSAQCSNNERVLAIATDSYLKPALKIAHSLASEICKAEEFSAQFQHSENCKIEISSSGVLPKLPVPSSDWSDRVVIHLSRGLSASCDGLDLQPLPFSPDKTSSDEDDLKAMLNSLVPGDTFLHEGNFSSGEQAADKFSFQNVVTAKFVFSLDSDDVPPHSSEAIERGRRIHSLGLLFYELFSGGQTAAAATSGTKSNVNMEESLDPLPVSQNTDLIDFGSAMNLIGDLEDSDRDAGGDFSSPSQAHDKTKSSRKKSKTCTNGTLSSASIEPLRMQKLPRSLCDLIENMINRIYGDLCGDEVYQNMSDVRDDLLLMIEKPDKFLHDIDLEKVSLSDLHLTETVFGREDEFARLLGSYQRALAGNSEVSIISGQSGTGKSMLAYRFGRFASTNGGLFLSGKFDQLKQSTPFSAIANAFNEYCNIISQNVSLNLSTVMASKLQEALGHEAFHLVKVIPNLRKILGTNIEGNDLIDSQSWVDSRKRLEYLLCQFVAVISSSSSLPIILFLDDLQWADEASIEVIKQLLLMSVSSYQCKQFFFVGCCRGDEMKQDHKIWTVFNGVRNFGVHTEIIELSCMDKETTNAMVSDVLCLSPRLTRPLSDILFHKTKGNPLFFCQIMSSWSKDGLLQLSLHRHRWEWEEERIQSTELPENVAMFFTGTIRNLPNEVQSGLCILSCFGATSTVKLIKLLEQAINTPLFQPLDKAVSEGLLIKRDEKYSFVHDHVQSAAYNLMKPEERCLYHFQYGLALCSGSMFSQDDDVIFTAVGQINRGGPSAVSNPAQGATIANLNLLAGKRAVGMADFKSAFTFFDHGISFLRKNHWKDHYDLSLELFDYAAKCSFFLGDNINLKILSEQILTYARSFHDKLNVMYITVSALSFAAKLPESIEKGIWILSQLGEDIPVSSSDSDIQMHVVQTRLMLNQFQDRDLLNYKVMTDRSKMMAMRFLARLETSLMMAKPSSQAFVTMKMVQLSISHGMSRISPVGFAHFGSLLGTLGNISEGYRYVKLAKQLLGRISGSNEVAGEVLKVSTNLVCFVEPVQSTIEFFKEGFNSSMASGDLITAMECSIYYSTSTFWVYSSLAIVKKNVENTRKMLEQQNHLTFLGFILPMSRTVSVLISSDVSDSFFDLITESTLEHALLDKNPFQWMILSFQKMYISFVFREVDILKHLAEKYFHVSFRPWTMTFVLSVQRFYGGLVSFWLYRQSGDSIWAERGHEAKLALSKWAESSQWNYQNKFYLLEAEDQYSNNDIENAKSSYTKAILSAREHKFINEEALACELAGYFYLSIDDKSTAVDYFTKAHEKYHEWGAFSKTSKLYEFVQSEFSFMQREPTQNSFQLNTQNDVNQGVSKRPSYH